MLHKARARNARPYGHGGVMHISFFRNIVGARIARPLLEFVQNFGFAHLLIILYFSRAYKRSSNFLAANRLRGFRIGSKAQMAEYSQFWQALNAPRSTGESSISPR